MRISFFCTLLVAALTIYSCKNNPITGRSQMSLIPETELQNMSAQQYAQFLASNRVVPTTTGNKDAVMVRRCGDRIIEAITKYYNEKGLGAELSGYKWEVNLVDDKTPNAWCMPGGKIVVYTGLLPITQNEDALAVVMGHEVAHALGKHGSERMSKGMIQQFGALSLSLAMANKPQVTQNLWMQAYGMGSNVLGILPFSRKHELEADRLGLQFSALAGYDPRAAIPFWQRMGQLSQGQAPPEFLSTHPSDGRRIEELNKIMDDVVKNYYRPRKS